jgi:hypothetical protein
LIIQALFAEARQRRRRIRLVRCGALGVLAIALATGLAWSQHLAGREPSRPASSDGTRATRAGQDPRLLWVNFDGRVLIGNLHTLSLRSVAEADVDFSTPLVPAGGLVYWVKQSGGFVDGAFWPRAIEALNPVTGSNTIVSPGEYVFKLATGSRVYAALTDTSVTELPPPSGPRGRTVDLTLPAGWYLPAGAGISVVGGIVVQSTDTLAVAHPAELAVWNPVTGQIRRLGRAEGAITAYTPPTGAYSLLAWMPASCRIPSCPITITNTVTRSSHTLHSPLHHGFVLGGAFSPDGRHFAVFANLSGQSGGQPAELAIASTGTSAGAGHGAGRLVAGVRMVPGVRMAVGEDADWIRWLPGGTTLITQANRDYLVNAITLAARPFRFSGTSQEINFSAELIQPPTTR